MLDAIKWETIPGSTDGVEWPFLRNETGSPSTGQAASEW
jgi:hypothetical protein